MDRCKQVGEENDREIIQDRSTGFTLSTPQRPFKSLSMC